MEAEQSLRDLSNGNGRHDVPVKPQRQGERVTMSDLNSPSKMLEFNSKVRAEDATVRFVAPPRVPEFIGRYRIDSVLGQGGYGQVYLALDEQLGRKVAIKVPHAELVSSPENALPYLAEARTVANLDHPHIVPVFDVGGTAEHPCFIVSKYIEGSDLATRIAVRATTHRQIAELIPTVAEALHYAHSRGLVHRDVKPANILIDGDGQPYVVDFGLALREDDIGRGAGYCGTPTYMSPEQARGEGHRVDARSDIFSLGVVFYELLAGRRPFQADSKLKILLQVVHYKPPAPSDYDETVPRELDRICLKALAKRASERYATALDMAHDLRLFLAREGEAPAAVRVPLRVDRAAAETSKGAGIATSILGLLQPIVPKGLWSYDAHDAEFFMGLLPGPRDREGIPETLRFWKNRIEETDPLATFSVGLIYGPSGCGKSSLVKAGLLPLLGEEIVPIYVEASGDATETRLEGALRRRFPYLKQDAGLKGILAALRRGEGLPLGKKVVLVLDQFEQWLHGTAEPESSELVQALRQCDGGNLQCLILVRDDFWLAVSRFMQALEIRILEGQNAKLVDLFDRDHAMKVLAAFGQAFGKLPSQCSAITVENRQFLEIAVQGMAQDGKVICVRLALFAEMMKSKPWTPGTLKNIGGTEGVGFSFLEETFAASTAPPQHRRQQAAAQAVLTCLLPAAGTDIRGHMRSRTELLEVSGYQNRESDFEELVRILDTELRLITPADPGDSELQRAAGQTGGGQYFQLSHDYLVHSLREWLSRKQKETLRGRTELLLEDRAIVWNARRENRQLPGMAQWLQIRRLTKPAQWTEPQKRMMGRAGRYYALRTLALTVSVMLLGVAAYEARGRIQAHALNRRLLDADTQEVAAIVRDIAPFRRWIDPLLKESLATASRNQDPRQELHARLALLPVDSSLAAPVFQQLLTVEPQDLITIRDALTPHKAAFTGPLWTMVETGHQGEDPERLRAATVLARFDPDNRKWKDLGETLVDDLVNVPPALLQTWMDGLQPVRRELLPGLAAVYRNTKRNDAERTMAASVLAGYATDEPGLLTELLLDADEKTFSLFYPLVARLKVRTAEVLTGELTRQPQAKWNDPPLNRDWRDPDATVRRQVEAASGVIADRFAFCQRMPLATFLTASESLTQSGYRPVRFRPFAGQSSIEVAAVWTRDGRVWQIAHGLSREAISKRFEELENKGFAMEDLAGYRDGTLKFGAIWVAKSPLPEDVRILVGLSEQELAAKYDLLWRWHYFPITLQVANDDAGRPVISQVCRHGSPRYCSKKFGIPRSSLPEMTASGYPLIDASVNPDKTRDVGFSALGQMDLSFTSVAVCSVNEAAHRQECQAVMAQDYRPASISVGRDKSNHPTIVSVWQRPLVVDEMKIRAAKRVSNAAAALLKMDHAEPVWPVLKSSSDPTPRSFLIHRLARYDVSAAFLYRRLVEETDPSIREALILSLGEYQPDNWKPEPEHVQYLKMIYATAADPGVHSAAEWLLRRWNEDAWLVKSQAELAGQSQKRLEVIASALHGANAKPQWYVNGQQQTMVAIPGPLEFEMGLSIADTIYYAQRAIMTAYWTEHDRTHPCRIGRSIAVAAKPVTLEQYRRFDAAHHQTPGFAPSPDCPVVAITWYQAAAYCNWLSKQEGIPADEWCYEMGPNGQVAKRRANYLKKRGYRLPTEAELEVAMRAGTKTARSFGEAEELLPDYSWYLANSFSRTWPVGTKKPNDWGVFDAHGNVICFCDDAYGPFHWKEVKHSIDDVEEAELSIKPDVARIMHGGSFRAEPVSTDSGVRYATLPTESDNLGAGFRPARTLP